MARRKEGAPMEATAPEIIDPQEGDLLDILDQIPGDSRSIQIWRMWNTGRPRFLKTVSPAEFSIEWLKETWGGGRFRLSFPVEGVRVERILEIDGPPIVHEDKPTSWMPNAVQPTPMPAGLDPFQQAVIQELRELKRNDGGNAQLTQVLLQIIANQSKSDDKVLDQMMKYRALFGQSQSSVDANTILSSLKMGLEIGGDGLGMSETKNPWLALAEKVLPMIAGVLQKAGQPAPESMPVVDSQALPNPNGNNGANMQQPLTGFAAVAEHLKPHLPTFINAAARDVDPNILVELALPMIPDNQKVVVLNWLKGDTWFTDLCSLSPIIAGQQSWWVDFAGEMVKALAEPDPDPLEKDD